MSWLVVYPTYDMAVALNINAWADEFSDFARAELAITRAFSDRAAELQLSD